MRYAGGDASYKGFQWSYDRVKVLVRLAGTNRTRVPFHPVPEVASQFSKSVLPKENGKAVELNREEFGTHYGQEALHIGFNVQYNLSGGFARQSN